MRENLIDEAAELSDEQLGAVAGGVQYTITVNGQVMYIYTCHHPEATANMLHNNLTRGAGPMSEKEKVLELTDEETAGAVGGTATLTATCPKCGAQFKHDEGVMPALCPGCSNNNNSFALAIGPSML